MTKNRHCTVDSSVGRAVDCRRFEISIGRWFNSGSTESRFLFHARSGIASPQSISKQIFVRVSSFRPIQIMNGIGFIYTMLFPYVTKSASFFWEEKQNVSAVELNQAMSLRTPGKMCHQRLIKNIQFLLFFADCYVPK